MAKRDKKEVEIQREICDWLSKEGFFFWRSNNVPVYARSNDGKMRFRSLPKYTPKGIPDIMVIHKGLFIGIEVKSEGSKLSEDQKKFATNLLMNGGAYNVSYSLESVKSLFIPINLIK